MKKSFITIGPGACINHTMLNKDILSCTSVDASMQTNLQGLLL